MVSGYDDMGPRIDLGGDDGHDDLHRRPGGGPSPRTAPAPANPGGKGGGGVLPLVSLVLALVAIALGIISYFSTPSPVPGPPASPEVVPGGAAERVAKLEKDVSQLILRLVTLEKELQSLANKAGTVTQLTELNAKVAALTDRLDAMVLDAKMASLSGGRPKPAPAAKPAAKPAPKPAPATKPAPAAKPEPKPAPKPEPVAKPEPKKPARKKLTYTVRRGDTLFTVAQRYKVRMKDLKAWNDIKSRDVIKIGQKLVIYK